MNTANLKPLNFNLDLPSRIITIRDNAINWVWYNQYSLHTSSWDKVLWGSLIASDRIHKFDERQGAEQHPKMEEAHIFNGSFYNRPDYGQIKAFGMETIKRWEQACEELGVSDRDCSTIVTAYKGDAKFKFAIR